MSDSEGRNPGVLTRLDYFRINDAWLRTKSKYRAEKHGVWLPDDLMIAEVRSEKVKQYVISTLEHFCEKKVSA